jgi:YD repeat-containing protein
MGVLLDLAPLSTVTDPLSHTTTFGHDPKGNLKTITNALGKITNIDVNTQGQPITIKDPFNNQTTFTYELGDLISVKDPLNRETKRMLDAAGRLRSIIKPLGQKTVYTPNNMRTARKGAQKPRPPAGCPLEAAYKHAPQESTLDAFIWKQALWPDLPQQIHQPHRNS